MASAQIKWPPRKLNRFQILVFQIFRFSDFAQIAFSDFQISAISNFQIFRFQQFPLEIKKVRCRAPKCGKTTKKKPAGFGLYLFSVGIVGRHPILDLFWRFGQRGAGSAGESFTAAHSGPQLKASPRAGYSAPQCHLCNASGRAL